MSKKKIVSFFCYLCFGALLALCEKKTGLYGLGLSFCVALVFCRENVISAIVPYALTSALVHFDLWYLILVASGVSSVLFYALIHVKANKKYRLWANIIVITVSQIPAFFIFGGNMEQIVKIALSPVVAGIYNYVSVSAAYPILVRGMRYKFTERERVFSMIFLIPLSAGLAVFDVFGVNFFFFFLMGICLIFAFTESGGPGLAVAMGAGASLITGSPFFLCASAAVGGSVFAFVKINKYLSGLGSFATFAFCVYYFLGAGRLNVATLVPPAVACLVTFVPDKIYARARGYRQSFYGKFALRTVANRDREEVSSKLSGVAYAFRKMERVLEREKGETFEPETTADGVFGECCKECGKFAVCKEKIGDIKNEIVKMISAGMTNGRITVSDVGEKMKKECVRLPRLINVANAFLREYVKRREERSGLEQGRDMMAQNLGGTAELLEELASSVGNGFGFDVEGERRIIDELACANVIAGDAAIYASGEKVTLTVRECDREKPEITKIVSEAVGNYMYVSEKSEGVNGTVNLVFRPNPLYGVLYGEKTVSAEEESGDAKQAVRVAHEKLLFVLSDGMGTGKNAHETGADAIGIIESFYRAGFGHKTIFSCAAKLLALRTEETFSALDVAILDTQTGEMDFIKQGGRESYIISGKGVEKIDGGTLPMGIIGDSEPRIESRKMSGNEIVVMVSDGVADRLGENDIAEIVGNLNTLNPQIIAEKITENALKKKDGHKDDMTTMAIRIVRNRTQR